MPYLVVGRRLDEKIVLRLAPGADEQALIGHLRTDGIEIVMASEGNVRIGVRAPEEIQILRAELLK